LASDAVTSQTKTATTASFFMKDASWRFQSEERSTGPGSTFGPKTAAKQGPCPSSKRADMPANVFKFR
jgi:hypothetical protein